MRSVAGPASPRSPTFEECEERSQAFDTSWGSWALYATDVVEFSDVVYRFDGEGYILQGDVMPALLALGAGCHELEIAESGISTHWSAPYQFCFVDSAAATSPSAPATPMGLSVTKVDIPLAPDDVRVTWNVAPEATWYELFHAAGQAFEWELKATDNTTPPTVDTSPEFPGARTHYSVRACNSAGCSAFSAVATQD